MKRCFVFPGQGSQYIGMGKELYDTYPSAKDVFETVNNALGFSLSDLMFSGDDAELNITENTQPALMAVSVATVRVLEQEFGKKLSNIADAVAGHSLGEYSALCASGAIDLTETAKLLKIRGQAMQKAVPLGVGAMAAVLGLDSKLVERVASDASDDNYKCSIANDNIERQIVISGHIQAIKKAIELAKESGAKRSIILPVSAPFHCSLMQPASDVMATALQNTIINTLSVEIITNVTANLQTDVEIIRNGLVEQVCGRVRWRESLTFMQKNGITNLVECGAGKVLSGMVRRIDGINGVSLNTPEDIINFVENL